MCWRPLRILLREPSGLSCEIVSDLCPNPFSHDWHVQPSCQRPNRDPPERREFSPGEPARVRIRLSSKPYKHTLLRKPCQRERPTEFPRVFHKGEFWAADRRAESSSAAGFRFSASGDSARSER